MTRTRSICMLFAVTSGAATAAADPAPTIQPRTLPSGAPACGNVSWKTPESPACKTARVILTAVAADLEQFRRILAVFEGFALTSKDEPLTLAEAARPRS